MEVFDVDPEYQKQVWDRGEDFEIEDDPVNFKIRPVDIEQQKEADMLKRWIRSTRTQLMDLGDSEIRNNTEFHVFKRPNIIITGKNLIEMDGIDDPTPLLEIVKTGEKKEEGVEYFFTQDGYVKRLRDETKSALSVPYNELQPEQFLEMNTLFGDINLLLHGIEEAAS
jgi:hypothetical protein